MRQYGLIGWPLGHSFSRKYFTEKFLLEGIVDAAYELFPLESIADFPTLLAQNKSLRGLNVTRPHKEAILPFLHGLDKTAEEAGAVNCIKIEQQMTGYNTDVIGFEISLFKFLTRTGMDSEAISQAFILGTGGAAKAVSLVLKKTSIPFKYVSRNPIGANAIHYEELVGAVASLPHVLTINCTPLGTAPDVSKIPSLPKEIFKVGNLIFDLVYNPSETLLLREAVAQGCFVQNGLEMLHAQAEAAWEIWQS